MARYIDAVECADTISEKMNIPLGDLVDVFAEIPTADVVEVVRCKDCKHFTKKGEEFLNNDVFGVCEKSRTGFYDDGEEVYGNDFCSCGERVKYESSKTESK